MSELDDKVYFMSELDDKVYFATPPAWVVYESLNLSYNKPCAPVSYSMETFRRKVSLEAGPQPLGSTPA